jgi:hypothetical protein
MGRIPDYGELLMLGFGVAQSTVSNTWCGGMPSQNWKTFLRNTRRRSRWIMCSSNADLDLLSFLFWGTLATATVVRGNAASDSRVVGSANHRGVSTRRQPTCARQRPRHGHAFTSR